MNNFIYFDYCALIVEALTVASLIIRKMTRGRVNRWALVLIGDIMIATVADITALLFEKAGSGNVIAKYITNTVCLWCSTLASVIFCGYLFASLGIWHKINKNRFASCMFNIPVCIMTVLLLIINPFTRSVFRINDSGMYERGPLFILLYILSYMYVVIAYYGVFRYRKLFTIMKMMNAFMVFFLMVLASVMQGLNPQWYVQMFFFSVAFMLMVFGVQSPEERMHGGTGLFSMNAYVTDINRYKQLNAPIGVTLSVMTNYSALIEMFGYFTVQNMINDTARRLEKWVSSTGADVDLYYLEAGRFAAIVDERYENDMLTISQGINSVLVKEVEVGEMLVKMMNNVCFISCPRDIDDPGFLFAFDGRLEEEVYSGELRYAEKLFDKKRFELRRDILRVIDRAFSEKRFALHYQPVYSVKDKRYVRAEAFLRLNDPDFGDIRPDLLISEAEKTNSIHAITAYVLEEVCRFISQPDFLLLGLEFIEVNLSAVQCMWSDFLPILLSTVRNYNVQPKNICFNITDVDSQEVFLKMRDNIDALSQVGFLIYMDDFGAGIFEVERIAKMPLSGIKLDRKFVKEGMKPENKAVFEGSIRMIGDLGLDAVAVGVENEEMENALKELSCDHLQGFLYCRPLEKKELVRFILMG
ncbi:MAG: EAL domain-containing protein [Lachnospiraceae bacterium]|nr:EAL domain-containing protein [Lachnospiraceae bacterium]